MKLSITLCVLFALVVIAATQRFGRGRGRGGDRGRGPSHGGRGPSHGGRGPSDGGRGPSDRRRGPSGGNRCGGRNSHNDGCHKAKRACEVTNNSGGFIPPVFMPCSIGACTRDAGTAVLNGVTYTFKRCSQRQPREDDEERHGVCLDNPPVLPVQTVQNAVVEAFCEPKWFHMACLVTSFSISGITIEKPQCECPHNGQCIPGAATGTYMYQGRTVSATFCTNCEDSQQQGSSACQIPDPSVYASWTPQQKQDWFFQAIANNCFRLGK